MHFAVCPIFAAVAGCRLSAHAEILLYVDNAVKQQSFLFLPIA